MAVKIVLVISISILIGAGAWSIIAPAIVPLLDDAHKGVLEASGRCPDVVINSSVYQTNTTGWFGFVNYCNGYVQYEVHNKGKNQATNVKINCVLFGRDNYKLAWSEKNIKTMQAGELKTDDIMINYDCGSELISHRCTVSFESPCQ